WRATGTASAVRGRGRCPRVTWAGGRVSRGRSPGPVRETRAGVRDPLVPLLRFRSAPGAGSVPYPRMQLCSSDSSSALPTPPVLFRLPQRGHRMSSVLFRPSLPLRRPLRRSLRAAAVTGAACLAVAVAAAPAAHAGPGGAFGTVYSLTQGPCVAVVDSSVNGDAYPNSAAFTVQTTMIGVGSCELTVTLRWRDVRSEEHTSELQSR